MKSERLSQSKGQRDKERQRFSINDKESTEHAAESLKT